MITAAEPDSLARLEDADGAVLEALARAVPGSRLLVFLLGRPSHGGARAARRLWPLPGPGEGEPGPHRALAEPFTPRWAAVLEAGHSLSAACPGVSASEQRLLSALGAGSVLAVPVATLSGTAGAALLATDAPSGAFSEAERAVLDAAAACAGASIARSRARGGEEEAAERERVADALLTATAEMRASIAALEARNREITLLAEMGRILQGCRSPREVHEVVGHFSPLLFPGSSGALFLAERQRGILALASTWGSVERGKAPSRLEQCWAARLGRLHWTAVDESFRCSHLLGPETASAMCVPLTVQGEPLGVLSIERRERISRATVDHPVEKLATAAAEQTALALANLTLREILQEQAIQDPLTGLYNRRHMEASLDHEVRRATRKKTSLGLLMLDLDRFKDFNDGFGHEAGDALLKAFGAFLRSRVRAEDVPCRYGGEEFTVLLPEATAADVLRRAEDICAQARQLAPGVAWSGGQTGVTVSIGAAVFPEHGVSAGSLLRAADEALYRSKAEGRDRVTMAGSPGSVLMAPRSGSFRFRE